MNQNNKPGISRVYSNFTPPSFKEPELSSAYNIMSQTSPIISSALNYSFPVLLLLDNFLSFITWTNDDPYYNFLCISGLVAIVLKWHIVISYLMPLLFAFAFSCFAWSIQSIVNETSVRANYDGEETDRDVPTIQEILDTLENISTRFEILFQPFKSFKSLNMGDIIRLALCTLWITPLQIFMMTYVVSVQKIVVCLVVIVLTYHSPWCIATRRLLWRSLYIRKLAFILTGLKFNTQNHSYDQKSFKILSDKKISAGKNGKIIEFEILENQRRWIAIGWCEYLLPYERSNFTTVSLSECLPPDAFEFTSLHSSHSWRWLENNWSLDFEFNKNKDGDGWVYYDSNWKYPSYYDGLTKYTRTRKWKRKAVLIVDTPDE